jgi:steroid 5-alpha reductase family enzyme
MNKDNLQAVVAIVLSLVIGGFLAWAGAQHGLVMNGYPVMYWCVAAAFAIQFVAFIPAFIFKTEKFYDLTGGLTYLSVTLFAISLNPHSDLRSQLIATFICIWAIRLASFLFIRVLRAGEDSRFARIKHQFLRFLMAWTLQGLWVTFSLAAGLAAITSRPVAMDVFACVGATIWLVGFIIESLADYQKSRFRANPANKGKFISTGLWSWSRHPNYFGEIVLWLGIAVMAFPVLHGWQLATLVSPVFVMILLTRISGIPLLEEAADARWGGQAEYENYKRRTSLLLPLAPKKSD